MIIKKLKIKMIFQNKTIKAIGNIIKTLKIIYKLILDVNLAKVKA